MFKTLAKAITSFIGSYTKSAPMMSVGKNFFPSVRAKHLGNTRLPIGASEALGRRFGACNNMPEIFKDYKVPQGLKYGHMQDYIMLMEDATARGNMSKTQFRSNVRELWGALTKLNPKLKQVDVSEGRGLFASARERTAICKMISGIIGVEDGFNISDLNFYNTQILGVSNTFNAKTGRANISPEYNDLHQEVKERCGLLTWRASPETLEYIKMKSEGLSPSTDVLHKPLPEMNVSLPKPEAAMTHLTPKPPSWANDKE